MTKIQPEKVGLKDYYTNNLQRSIQTRREFLDDFRSALLTGKPYAVGRIGISEQFWLYNPIFRAEQPGEIQLRVFDRHMEHHSIRQGIFPVQTEFLLEYANYCAAHVKNINSLGLILDSVLGSKILDFHEFHNKLIYFKDQIYDKFSPADPENCYLDALKGKKLSIICPFAGLLKERAIAEIFEGDWGKTGKKWFHPEAVNALEIPYGFSRETQARFGNTINQLEAIQTELSHIDFDVALVAAAGLSIPIDSFVKKMGRTSLSLGGDLQVLFGVIGKRWRDKLRWQQDYFNEFWIDMPERYRPKGPGFREGAYC